MYSKMEIKKKFKLLGLEVIWESYRDVWVLAGSQVLVLILNGYTSVVMFYLEREGEEGYNKG